MRASAAPQASASTRERLRQAIGWAQAHFQRNLRETAEGKRAAQYARRRGFTDDTIKRFGLGYALDSWDDLLSHASRTGISRELLSQAGLVTTNDKGKTYDRFRHRLIFPIRDTLGRCVAFGGRTLGDDPAKYLNSPETALFSKSRILYGLDVARPSILSQHEAVVVEGYTDAALLSQAGIKNVVATLGTAFTDAHLKLLSQLSGRIVMCFDSDEAGLRAADRALETALRHGIDVRVALTPAEKDPADFVIAHGPDAFRSLLQSATPALEFKWNRTAQGYRERGQQGRRDAIDAFLRFVARVTLAGGIDPLDQGLLVGRLAELIPLPAGTVYEFLTKAKAAAARESAYRVPDTSAELSTYEASIRGLPLGMVSAIEESFGLALAAPECFDELREGLAAGARCCEHWERLNATLAQLTEERSTYARADVIERCEDGALCELVSRASERVAALPVSREACRRVSERALSEAELLQMGGLRGRLGETDANQEDQERTFRSLLDAARRQHSVLGAQQRWGTSR